MKERLVHIAAYTGCVSALVTLFLLGGAPLEEVGARVARHAQAAAVFFSPSITIGQVHDKYHGVLAGSPLSSPLRVRVLLVPGHQPSVGGTQFGGVYERDLVVDVADALAVFLSQNPRFDVFVARSKTAWNPVLQNYFNTHTLEIETFRQSQVAQMQEHVAEGNFRIDTNQVYHNAASSEGVTQLYGINKWSSDNDYDLVLHLHLNDYAGRRARTVGKYTGFSIYVPDAQYSNATVSKAIGNAIAVRLNAYHATSTLPKEDAGVLEDRELIAIGSNNSVDGAALLIEYGYIYEPLFQEPSVREVAITDYAYQTYLGIQDFFKDPVFSKYGSISFPYDWAKVTGKKNERGPQVYALQSALRYLGYYPPAGKSFTDCPLSGVVGNCTRSALMEYQTAKGIEALGTVGEKTRDALQQDLSVSLLY